MTRGLLGLPSTATACSLRYFHPSNIIICFTRGVKEGVPAPAFTRSACGISSSTAEQAPGAAAGTIPLAATSDSARFIHMHLDLTSTAHQPTGGGALTHHCKSRQQYPEHSMLALNP
mmetsp:Transcript_35580/g.79028  ORF Transcript_35580/g.79028 Transcript_35580/m.79028 type:complete len:117 (-) Transcript_35580:3408-3758(-)